MTNGAKSKSEEILDNYTRARIFNYVFRNSGTNYNQIESAVEIRKGLIYYHLGILKQAGYVKTIGLRNAIFYYASGKERDLLSRLKDDGIPKTLENAITMYKNSLRSLNT